MRERPILFSREMARAVLDDRKTETRRLVKWQPYTKGEKWNWTASSMDHGYRGTGCPETGHVLYSRDGMGCWNQRTKPVFCPYGKPGERLWVRETFYIDDIHHLDGPVKDIESEINRDQIYYRADGECCDQIPECSCAEVGKPRWRPSMNMPRWASRINLEIISTRIERLWEISEQGAIAEGAPLIDNPDYDEDDPCDDSPQSHRAGFIELWDTINGESGDSSWMSNPWVWVIEFRKL